MDRLPRGLRPHTHDQRSAVVDQLLPLWQRKFGDNLLAVAVTASYARGTDLPYSDLEFEVFLRNPVPPGEDHYLQRIVNGMLVEALYDTEESYFSRRAALNNDWPLAASEILVAIYNQPFIAALTERLRAVHHPPEAFILLASHRFYEVQEACGKVFNALEMNNREGLPLLLFDALMQMLAVLSFINQTPFITYASFIHQARQFPIQPPGWGDLLDIIVSGGYTSPPRVQDVLLVVMRGFEDWFDAAGFPLYDSTLDPNQPNRSFTGTT